MKDFKKHLILHNDNVLNAFEKLNHVPDNLTLFVVDEENKLVGTLTDGDIRRGFLNGKTMDSKVYEFMNVSFHYLSGIAEPDKIQQYRKLGVKMLPVLNDDDTISRVIDLNKKKTVLPIDAVIMAGGKGERLRPLTDKKPKPMLPLGNKPIIEYNIDRLISFGIENIYISINYLGDQIVDYFGDGSEKGINIRYLKEEKFLGTIGSVKMVEEFQNPYVLVMNSDLFTDVDVEDLLLNLQREDGDLTVASIPYTVNIPFAILKRENDRITGLKEKPSNTHYANAGIYLMKQEIIDVIPEVEFFNATDLIEKVIDTGGKVIDNPITGYWIDIGRHEEYEKAKEIVKHLNKYNV
jgi:dTDP-glucose pyrophosphorylase